jgi:hypothetical protein
MVTSILGIGSVAADKVEPHATPAERRAARLAWLRERLGVWRGREHRMMRAGDVEDAADLRAKRIAPAEQKLAGITAEIEEEEAAARHEDIRQRATQAQRVARELVTLFERVARLDAELAELLPLPGVPLWSAANRGGIADWLAVAAGIDWSKATRARGQFRDVGEAAEVRVRLTENAAVLLPRTLKAGDVVDLPRNLARELAGGKPNERQAQLLEVTRRGDRTVARGRGNGHYLRVRMLRDVVLPPDAPTELAAGTDLSVPVDVGRNLVVGGMAVQL